MKMDFHFELNGVWILDSTLPVSDEFFTAVILGQETHFLMKRFPFFTLDYMWILSVIIRKWSHTFADEAKVKYHL